MKLRILSYIAREIHRLTDDEDLRQELWLYFFEGHSPFTFESYLKEIIRKQNIEKEIIQYMESIDGFKKKL
jgi:hypothetical protein